MTEPPAHGEPAGWQDLCELETVLGTEGATTGSFRGESQVSPTLPTGSLFDLETLVPAEDVDALDALTVLEAPASGESHTPRPELTQEEFAVGEEIGRGGMGAVLRARQLALGRDVALKVPLGRAGTLDDFVAEARVTGFLDHANVVPVHSLRRAPDGGLQLAMKLVRGKSWDALLKEEGHPADLPRHLEIFRAICNAVSLAHDRGVLHRDLKPANVMVGEFGQVFVMDWGLAVATRDETAERLGVRHVRDVEQPAGTPAYMAPELATGEGAKQSERTDVYLLGACLHRVLTGKTRHDGTSITHVLINASRSEPVEYPADLPRELGEICNRATHLDPAQRHASVGELRAAVEAFLEHQRAAEMTRKGRGLVDELRVAISEFAQADDDGVIAAQLHVHQVFAGAQFALDSALELWDGERDAVAAREDLTQLMLEHALATEDVTTALKLLPLLDEERAARVKALQKDLEGRGQELESLRESARRMDWSAVSRALGKAFVFGGSIAALGPLFASYAVRQEEPYWFWLVIGVWAVILPSLGLLARQLFRNTRVPDSLVSRRVMGMWGAVALGCMLNQVVVVLQGQEPQASAAGSALLIGAGFAGMAFQTRRWVLIPAAVFTLASLGIAASQEHGLLVFASVWLVVFVAMGSALTHGARLDPEGATDGGK